MTVRNPDQFVLLQIAQGYQVQKYTQPPSLDLKENRPLSTTISLVEYNPHPEPGCCSNQALLCYSATRNAWVHAERLLPLEIRSPM